MAVQPTPPIQLDPSMDKGHQLAFINQNFNNIASVIGQNSFVIVKEGTIAFPGLFTGQSSVTHNLGITPAFQAYIFVPPTNLYYQVPWLLLDNATGAIQALVTASADATTFYVDVKEFIGLQPLTVKYYLLQQTAN